jgi:hypothetical protein
MRMKKGSHQTEEAKEKNRLAHLGKKASQETKDLLRIRKLGDNNPMKQPNARAKISKYMTENNPMKKQSARDKLAATKTGIVLSNEHKENIRIGTKEALADPEIRKIMSESHKDIPRPQYVKDAIGKGNTGKVRTIDARKKVSCSKQGISLDEFSGFVSFEPYCEKFNESLRERVRTRFDCKCALCNKTQENNIDKREKHWKLSVHHVFIEKLACCETKIEEMDTLRTRLPPQIARFGEPEFSEEELKYIRMMVPLCLSCHGIMNGESDNVPYEKSKYRRFFAELIIAKYEGNCY